MSTSSTASLSQHEIEEQVAQIEVVLEQLRAGDGDMARLGEVAERLALLRAQYRAHPESLNGYVPKLRQLGKRFEALLASRLSEVVDRFHRLGQELHRIEREKEFWLKYLISRAGPGRQEKLAGVTADVIVRSLQTRSLPPAGGEARTRLEGLVRETGHWQEVSQLARAKLDHALAKSLFTSEQRRAISELCPAAIVHQVSSRARDK